MSTLITEQKPIVEAALDKKPTISLCLIVKADDGEAEVLRRGLSYVVHHVNEICITITGKNEKVKEVAELYGAKVSYFEWCNDFAKARNFNFSQAASDYIFWIDADDVVRGAESLSELVKKMADEAIDTMVMNYLYEFDEDKTPIVVHLKTRIVKNDGCVKWEGRLHEDFSQQRNITGFFTNSIEILHITDEKRIERAIQRNLEIALEINTEHPDDPRSAFLVANAAAMANQPEKAIEYYLNFVKVSGSDEEKFIAWLRLAAVYRSRGNMEKAIESDIEALKLRPWYPDAYFGLGQTYKAIDRLEHAKVFLLEGLQKKPPTFSIVAYNPRDYDYNPMMMLANVYLEQGRPKDSLEFIKYCQQIYPKSPKVANLIKVLKSAVELDDKAEEICKKADKISVLELHTVLESLPEDIKYHPKINILRNTRFIKQQSSGKDIAIFCGFTEEEWRPDTVKEKGVGGSEEAVINLARRWVKAGWHVEVYNNCGYRGVESEGVFYKPFQSWNYRDKQDIVILWRSPKLADYKINTAKLFVDLHDVISPMEFTPERLKKINKIFVKTKAHRGLFPNIPDEKFVIIPNGLNPSDFDSLAEKDRFYFLNTSSPDRHLWTSLELFERIVKAAPVKITKRLKFGWFYGWGVWNTVNKDEPRAQIWKAKVEAKMEELRKAGQFIGGSRINHSDIAREYLKAGVLFYPTEFFEIHCISVAKAQAAGCIPLTTDFAALKETNQWGPRVHSNKDNDNWPRDAAQTDYGVETEEQKEQFVKHALEILENESYWGTKRVDMAKWAKKIYDWDNIAKQWEIYF